MPQEKVAGLASVGFLPTEQDDVVVLSLRDTSGKEATFAIGPEGLNFLLMPALGLATQWADKADLQADTVFGPMRALPATAVRFDRGRDPTEAAIRVKVGQVELSFLTPLPVLLSAIEKLASSLDFDPAAKPH